MRVAFFWRMATAGRDAGDLVHIGLFHALQELAGVGGKGFDVAALAFGVNGVKGQGGFAGAADAGDDGEGFVGDFDGDVLEVVDAGAAHTQNFLLLEGGSDGFVRRQREAQCRSNSTDPTRV